MPEFEAWPGQIYATRAMFNTSGASETGPHCYEHETKWKRGCSWCRQAKQNVSVWEENKMKAASHEEQLESGEWSIINLAIELNDHLFERSFGDDALTAEELLAWAYKLAAKVREQADDVDFPNIEEFGAEVLAEFRAAQ